MSNELAVGNTGAKIRDFEFGETLQALRTLSDITQRLAPGFSTFGGDRNIYDALGYSTVLTAQMYRDRYSRGGIAPRIVEAAPRDTWSENAFVVETEDPNDETEFELAFKELDKRLHLWSMFYRLDVLLGLGRYAVLVMGLPGDPESEIQKFGADDLQYLMPYGESSTTISRLERDVANPRFNQPVLYSVKIQGQRSFNVHWSRVLHVCENNLDSPIYGLPRLERVWNDLDNLDKIVGSGSEAFWLRVHKGFHFNLDKDVVLKPEEILELKDNIKNFVHGMTRAFFTRGTTMEDKGSDVANFSNQVDSILSLIAGATSIPKRILIGSERGELASSQDEGNWEGVIANRRKHFAEPALVGALVDRLIAAGALPTPEQWNVRWPERNVLNDTQRAAIAVQWAGINNAMGERVVSADEIRDHVLLLEPMDESGEEQDAPNIFTPAQVQAALQMMQLVEDGKLQRDAAVKLMEIAFQISTQEAQELLREPTEVTTEPPLLSPAPPGTEDQPPQDPAAELPVAAMRAARGKVQRPPARARSKYEGSRIARRRGSRE